MTQEERIEECRNWLVDHADEELDGFAHSLMVRDLANLQQGAALATKHVKDAVIHVIEGLEIDISYVDDDDEAPRDPARPPGIPPSAKPLIIEKG
jgi:hypothetical protein